MTKVLSVRVFHPDVPVHRATLDGPIRAERTLVGSFPGVDHVVVLQGAPVLELLEANAALKLLGMMADLL